MLHKIQNDKFRFKLVPFLLALLVPMLISLNNSIKLPKRQAMGHLFIISLVVSLTGNLFAKNEKACTGSTKIKDLAREVGSILENVEEENPIVKGSCEDFIENHLQKFEGNAGERNSKNLIKLRLEKIFSQASNYVPPNDALHMFYRAWPNAFYSILAEEKNDAESPVSELLKAFPLEGLIPGDVHVENYSFFTREDKDSGDPELEVKINDFDESGYGPYVSDLIRLMGSMDMADKYRVKWIWPINIALNRLKSQMNLLERVFMETMNFLS